MPPRRYNREIDMNKEIFMTELKINKVRHLENIDIPLSKTEKKHLIITGKNGSGKTSLLEAVRDLLVAYETDGFSQTQHAKVTLEFNALDELAEKWKNHEFTLSFFEAKRRASMAVPQGPQKSHIKDNYKISGDTPNQIFLQYLVNLKVEQSFARDDEEFETVEKIEQWFNMLEETFGELFEDEHLQLKFDRKNYNFYILTKNRERFDFNTLSDGYSAIINILSDLIIRMENKRTESYDMQGIVLIDEIETHLHVELQKKILPFLRQFFPQIQFIA
jgi:predicted ATP-binding protein involved in virulence